MQIQQQQNNIPGHMRTPDLWCNIEQCVWERLLLQKGLCPKQTCSIFDFPSSLERVKKKWRISAHALTNEKVTPSSFILLGTETGYLKWNTTPKNTQCNVRVFHCLFVSPSTKEKKNKNKNNNNNKALHAIQWEMWFVRYSLTLSSNVCVCVSVWKCATERPICCQLLLLLCEQCHALALSFISYSMPMVVVVWVHLCKNSMPQTVQLELRRRKVLPLHVLISLRVFF